ncbi:gluconokinase [Roseivirga sp.]|uniref:gluconokinase n=1 Tax=Roseivirga sp. TaxID=1964215 RepID=UPI003B8AA77C
MSKKRLIIVMGISGSGKSTIGRKLADKLGIPFLDADDFHPNENIKKMSRGVPLDDDDRWPWLGAIVEYVKQSHRNTFVLACSALKQSYRDYLGQRLSNEYVFLKLNYDEGVERLKKRENHFMPTSLIQSQLDTLEEPKSSLTFTGSQSPNEITILAADHFADFI